MGGACSPNCRSAFRNLAGKPTGKRHLGRPRRGCEDDIRADIKEIGVNVRNRIDSSQGRDYWRVLVYAASNLCVPEARESVRNG